MKISEIKIADTNWNSLTQTDINLHKVELFDMNWNCLTRTDINLHEVELKRRRYPIFALNQKTISEQIEDNY